MGVDPAQTNAATMLVQVAEAGGLGWTSYLPLNRCVTTTTHLHVHVHVHH
jgi:hypothetical protein